MHRRRRAHIWYWRGIGTHLHPNLHGRRAHIWHTLANVIDLSVSQYCFFPTINLPVGRNQPAANREHLPVSALPTGHDGCTGAGGIRITFAPWILVPRAKQATTLFAGTVK